MGLERWRFTIVLVAFGILVGPVRANAPPPTLPWMVPGSDWWLPQPEPIVLAGVFLSAAISMLGLWILRSRGWKVRLAWVVVVWTLVSVATASFAVWATMEHAANQRRRAKAFMDSMGRPAHQPQRANPRRPRPVRQTIPDAPARVIPLTAPDASGSKR
jgi:hypothetical protein